MKTIRGKKALVTGAGSGIGRAIALRLAGEGADVCLIDIRPQALADVAEEVRSLGAEALSIPCDVSRPAEIEAAVIEVLEKWGAIDILVNNAGIVYYGPTQNMTAEQWELLLAINLHAPIHFIRLLLPVLLKQPQAQIVNVASMFGLVGTRKSAAYTASKFALVGLSEALRAEYGRFGLGVMAVCPGFVETSLFVAGISGERNGRMPRPPRWVCATPDRVAHKVIRGIYRNRAVVLVTPLAYLLHYVKRFAPWLLDWMRHWNLRPPRTGLDKQQEKMELDPRAPETKRSTVS